MKLDDVYNWIRHVWPESGSSLFHAKHFRATIEGYLSGPSHFNIITLPSLSHSGKDVCE